jgi:hypothetical protein
MPAAWSGYRQGSGGYYRETDGSGPYTIDASGVATLIGLPVASTPLPAGSSVTSVAGTAANTNLLAANAARRGAVVFNESTAVLYLKLGSASSVTSYTVQIAANGYYEVPFGYTGIITGIWASANGNARVTELT